MEGETRHVATVHSGGDPPRSRHAAEIGRPSTWRRVAPAVGLILLAPLVGEYLLGNISIRDLGSLIVLAPMYGSGALLIREAARRAGRGWPTILLLALAYGVLQPSLLDHSLFNPSYGGLDFRDVTYIPALGVSAYHAVTFTLGHAIWSMSVPIALVETLVPLRSTTPWLGKVGLAVTGALFLLGSYIIFDDHRRTQQFLPSAPQMITSAAVVVALIVAAFAVGGLPGPRIERRAPKPWPVGASAFVASSLFFARSESWLGVAVGHALVIAMTGLVARWSRCDGWGAAHRLALAGGALLTYAWGGFVLTALLGRTGAVDRMGNVVFAAGALALLAATGRVVRRTGGGSA